MPFDYIRNRDLNANDVLQQLRRRSHSGAGSEHVRKLHWGPDQKEQDLLLRQLSGHPYTCQGAEDTAVPTATAKEGIFQYVPAGQTAPQQYSIVANDPLNKGIDPTVAALLSLFPAPNNFNVGDGFNSTGYELNYPNNSLSDHFTTKMNYNYSDKIHFFERTSWQRNTAIDSVNGAQNVVPGEAPGTQGGKRWGVAGGMDWTLSSAMSRIAA
jgi:hypothetical protein